MWIKQSGGKVFGATFTAKEQKAIDIEINRQILEADEKYQNNIDASVLYALRVYAGWGLRNLGTSMSLSDLFMMTCERITRCPTMMDGSRIRNFWI